MGINRERLNFILKNVADVFDSGKKIPLNSETAVINEVFSTIHDKRMLVENPAEYFSSEEYKGLGFTGTPALPYQSTATRMHYARKLKDEGLYNVRVIGTVISQPNERKLDRLEEVSDGFILPATPSLQGVYEFLRLVEKRAASVENGEQPSGKPVFIDNKDKNLPNVVFDLIAKDIGLGTDEMERLGLRLKNGVPEIVEAVKQQVAPKKFNAENEFDITAGATFYVATTSDKKLLELQKFYENYGVKIKSLAELVGSFKDADELHGTIEANAIGTSGKDNTGKLYTIAEKVRELGKDDILRRLQERGEDPGKVFMLTDDRGGVFSPELANKLVEKYGGNLPKDIYKLLFGGENSVESVIKNKPLPGPEVKHFIDAMDGVGNFWHDIGSITKGLNYKHHYIENSTVVAVSPLMDAFKPELRVFSTSGEIKYGIMSTPKPEIPYKESEQYTYNKKDSRSLAEMLEQGDWDSYHKLTDVGRAFKSLADNFGLKRIKLSDQEPYHAYGVGLISSKEYPVNSYRVQHTNNADNLRDPVKADNFLKDNHCIVFDGNISKDDMSAVRHAFFKAVVAKQTDPRDMNKTIIVNQPNENFNKLINLYYSLYGTGYIKQYPPRMFSVATSNEHLVEQIDSHARGYVPAPGFSYDAKKELHAPERTKNETVFIACSASSDNQENIYIAAKTAFHLALSGKNIAYGSGDKKMMGAIYEGFMAAKEYAANNGMEFGAKIFASSTSNILKMETLRGVPPEGLDDFHHAETIEHRKHYLYNSSHSAIILPGGAGTVEEFAYCHSSREKDGRNYEINVLNYKQGYDHLKETNGNGTKFYSQLDRMLENSYKVDMNSDASKTAESFLLEKLSIPKEFIASLAYIQGVNAKQVRGH